MEELSTERIIGDFLEINSDIIEERFYSKLPKFIAKYIENRQKKKLIKTVLKLSEYNLFLKKDNIYELALYIYNSFREDGYKNIYLITYFPRLNNRYIISVNIDDNYSAILTVDRESEKININITKVEKINVYGYDFDLTELKINSGNREIYKVIEKLNNILVDITISFIIDSINSDI